jgi:death-on-curing protein
LVLYLSIAQIEELHRLQLRAHGGAAGIRDRGGLEAAVARPQMTFGGEDLYPDVPAKTAALMHSLVLNHAFIDGNKRVGAHAALVFALANGWAPVVTPDELVDITMSVARSELDIERLTIWFRQHLLRAE